MPLYTRSCLALALALAAGCHTATDEPRPVAARFYLETNGTTGAAIGLPRSGVQITIGPKPVLTEYDVLQVDIAEEDLGRCLRFRLTPEAGRDLRRMARAYPASRLVLLVNGEPLGARRLEALADLDALLVFVELPDAELPVLVDGLQQATAKLRRTTKSL